jgi:hypothetical protein
MRPFGRALHESLGSFQQDGRALQLHDFLLRPAGRALRPPAGDVLQRRRALLESHGLVRPARRTERKDDLACQDLGRESH